LQPAEIRTEALALIAQGLNDCEISRRLGVPRTTVLMRAGWWCSGCTRSISRARFRSTVRARSTTARIVLEPWQERRVAVAPWEFLRGCIRSDGCAFINRTGPYEYLSYAFANHSSDIVDLFERTCRGLGLRPRRYARCIRLNRREDVAGLVMHIGTKT